MPYKNPEKQNEYLRRWRAKKQRERLQREKQISKLFFSLYLTENPKKEKRRVKWLICQVFDRVLEKEEAELLMNHFSILPHRFLEALLVCWRERGFREISVLEFIDQILLPASPWEICAECGRPFPKRQETGQ